MPYICTPYKISYGNIPNQTSINRENDKNLNMYVRPSTYLIQILKLFETLSTRPRLYGINVKSNFAGWQQTIHAKIFFWKWYMMLFKFNLAHSPHMFPKNIWYLLAPTGALIVIVCYYWSSRQLFQILSISANIFSFSFWELMQIDKNWNLGPLGPLGPWGPYRTLRSLWTPRTIRP